MIEHDMDFIGRLCDPVIVMAEGSVLFEGSVEEAKKDEKGYRKLSWKRIKIKGYKLMAYFEGIEMTGGYGNGPDIISSCSVNVNKGEIVSILGPNGAGKSTAMKAMLGLLNLKSGSVKIDGKDISKLSPQDQS